MNHYDYYMLKSFLRWLISCSALCIHTAGMQRYRWRERERENCGRKKRMDSEDIVHSQGAVGEVKHIAWGLFQISLSCGYGCVFWLFRFRLCARWTLNLLSAAFQHLHRLQADLFC